MLETISPGGAPPGLEEKENAPHNQAAGERTAPAERKGGKTRHRAGDWVCIVCNNHNYSFREVCNRCKQQTKQQNIVQSLAAYQVSKLPEVTTYPAHFSYAINHGYSAAFFPAAFAQYPSAKQNAYARQSPTAKEEAPQPVEEEGAGIFGFEWLGQPVEVTTHKEEETAVEESAEDISRNAKLWRLFNNDY